MAITKITEARYTGKSTDIKPREATLGATFWEYDSRKTYEKTLDINNGNNGWVLQTFTLDGGGTSSDTVKGKLTVKSVQGVNFLVIMAGNDELNWEVGDIAVGEVSSGRISLSKVTILPVTTVADLKAAIQGSILT